MDGQTALIIGAGRGHTSTCEALVEARAGLEVPDSKGITPLVCSSSWGEVATTKLLLEVKADIEAIDHQGSTALMHTCGCRMGGQNITTAQVLVEAKANLDATDNAGSTALDYAVATDQRTGLDQHASANGGVDGSMGKQGIGFGAAMRSWGAEHRGQEGDGAWASRHI